MIIYEMGKVQFYAGMISLEDYIRFMCTKNVDNNLNASHYMNIETLREFVVNCFMEVKSMEVKWDGTAVNIWLGAIPRTNSNYPFRFLLFEQKENGNSFLVSETILSTPQNIDMENRIRKIEKKYSKRDIFEWMKECCRIADGIFSDVKHIEKRKYEKSGRLPEKQKTAPEVKIPKPSATSSVHNGLDGFVRIA